MALISQAQAADAPSTTPEAPAPAPEATTTATVDASGTPVDPAAAPNAGESLAFNIGFILLLFVMFYLLMIRPQQKRMKEQQTMITALAKGDRVITNGGIIGTITKAPADDSNEFEIEIADGVKVTVLRYSIYKKYDASEYAPKKAA